MSVPFNKVGKTGKGTGLERKGNSPFLDHIKFERTIKHFGRNIKETLGRRGMKLRGDHWVGHRLEVILKAREGMWSEGKEWRQGRKRPGPKPGTYLWPENRETEADDTVRREVEEEIGAYDHTQEGMAGWWMLSTGWVRWAGAVSIIVRMTVVGDLPRRVPWQWCWRKPDLLKRKAPASQFLHIINLLYYT